jgi:hypothetical protein
VTKAKPSQKNTIESFNYEIAEPIAYCSLELFAILIKEDDRIDGDVRESQYRYRFAGGGPLRHFKRWALEQAQREDDGIKICPLCFWTYGKFYPQRDQRQEAA